MGEMRNTIVLRDLGLGGRERSSGVALDFERQRAWTIERRLQLCQFGCRACLRIGSLRPPDVHLFKHGIRCPPAVGDDCDEIIDQVDPFDALSRPGIGLLRAQWRSEEHTSELQSLMRISYAVLSLTNKQKQKIHTFTIKHH